MALQMIRRAYDDLGIRPSVYRLSLPGPDGKYVGDAAMWQHAADVLVDVLDGCGVAYDAAEGEAAFYGPKIDVQIADRAGREATLSTVQVDFYQPAQFDLEYTGADGAKHRPVMVHRSVIGSVERAVAHLIEVHGGAFPAWLAPIQVMALPVSDAQMANAARLVRRCLDEGLRAEASGPEHGSLAARIRAARLVPLPSRDWGEGGRRGQCCTPPAGRTPRDGPARRRGGDPHSRPHRCAQYRSVEGRYRFVGF